MVNSNRSISSFYKNVFAILLLVCAINDAHAAPPITYSDSLNIIRLRAIKKTAPMDSVDIGLRWGPGGYCYNPTDTFDADCDAAYMGKSGLDMASIDMFGKFYANNNGTALFNASVERRSVALLIFNLVAGNSYAFKIIAESALKGNNKLYLYDRFTKTYTQIDDGSDPINHLTTYNFSTTADTLSTSVNRFYVVFNLANTKVWKGTISSNFNDPNNWYPFGVPDSLNDVSIDTNKVLQLSQNATFRNLTLHNGSSIKLNGKSLTIIGDIAGSGNISSTPTSNLTLTGSGAVGTINFDQTTLGSTNALNNFSVNRTSNGSVMLGNNLSINGILNIASGSSLYVNGNTLTLAGTYTGTGTLAGSATSNLIITGTGALGTLYFNQSKPDSTNIFRNLTLNRTTSGTAQIGNKLVLLGTFTPTDGVVNTNDSLVLRSTVTEDARISSGSASGGYIVGRVAVERFLAASPQWRMVGFPFRDTTKIRAAILSSFFSANSYIAYSYEESADNGVYGNTGLSNVGWVILDAAKTTTSNKGLIITGGTNNTIQILGPLNTGNKTVKLSYTSSKINNGWNMIANPFPSNIDWDIVMDSNVSAKINRAVYRWDPVSLGYAAYVNGFSTGNQSKVIENGAAVFVKSTGDTTLLFTEACKTSSAPAARLFSIPSSGTHHADVKQLQLNNTHQSIIKLNLKKLGDVAADEAIVRWGNAVDVTNEFDDQYDALDLGRSAGPDLAIIDAKQTAYAIFHGTELKTALDENRSVQLQTSGLLEGQTYQMNMEVISELANNNKAYLLDKYKREYTAIEKANTYSFSVNTDSLAKSEHRLMLVFNKKEGAAMEANTGNIGMRLIQNPIQGTAIQLLSLANYDKIDWQLMDNAGRLVHAGNLNNVLSNQTYQITTNALASGFYVLQIKGDGKLLPTLKIVK
jgi:hypothetical protein